MIFSFKYIEKLYTSSVVMLLLLISSIRFKLHSHYEKLGKVHNLYKMFLGKGEVLIKFKILVSAAECLSWIE